MAGVCKNREDAKHHDHGNDYPKSNFGAQTVTNGIGEQSFKKTLYHVCLPSTSNLAKSTRIPCERQMTFGQTETATGLVPHPPPVFVYSFADCEGNFALLYPYNVAINHTAEEPVKY